MTPQHRDFGQNPQSVCEERFDAIWVFCGAASNSAVMRHVLVQFLDWRMAGLVRRSLGRLTEAAPVVFLPTMRKLASPFIVCDRRVPPAWANVNGALVGIKANRILLIDASGEDFLSLTQSGSADWIVADPLIQPVCA